MSDHREIDCPVCKGPLCELDGDVRTDEAPTPVFILLYTHKHGEDVSAYRTLEGATSAAFDLACQRADEGRWHDEEKARFDAAETPEEALSVFHEIELNYNYSECLEITESVLGD